MIINRQKVKACIKEINLTLGEYSDKIGISRASFSQKICGKRFFTEDEIAKMYQDFGLCIFIL